MNVFIPIGLGAVLHQKTSQCQRTKVDDQKKKD
jgi:hypothetical protein